ncbi:hypothetical protein HPP92_028156 [Vanilla planifolia]|uniref:Uncharacterized protein n=1 Tax=Vanilla planifolia TaxID=51239 RepID=A0A835PC43_VANPL|nr:hypothetical protein HPP92_028156 [Vanilla planifolia]
MYGPDLRREPTRFGVKKRPEKATRLKAGARYGGKCHRGVLEAQHRRAPPTERCREDTSLWAKSTRAI